jgi:hypothetical protein
MEIKLNMFTLIPVCEILKDLIPVCDILKDLIPVCEILKDMVSNIATFGITTLSKITFIVVIPDFLTSWVGPLLVSGLQLY